MNTETEAELRTEEALTASRSASAIEVGGRLRALREQRGWSLDDVGERLHLTRSTITHLETGDFERIGAWVYVKGYLRSYARQVELDEAEMAPVLARPTDEPHLAAAPGARFRPGAGERYARGASYLIGTALVVGNLWFWIARDRSEPELDQLSPPYAELSETGVGYQEMGPPLSAAPYPAGSETARKPTVATLTPFPSVTYDRVLPTAELPPGFEFSLRLDQDSWVEVSNSEGRRLEYSLLRTGQQRSYRSELALSVRIGNASGVEVSIDGQRIDLAERAQGNVVRFELARDGSLLAPADPSADR